VGTGVTGRTLRRVWGSGSNWVAVGDTGTIVRSPDDGANWAAVESGVTRGLLGVWGDGSTVLAVGRDGAFLRSVDGGSTWAAFDWGASTLYSVWGSGGTALVVGELGLVDPLHRRGGKLERREHRNPDPFRRRRGSGSTVIVAAVGGGGLYSTDGGGTFQWMSTGAVFDDVWGSSPGNILAIAHGNIFRTGTQGEYWMPVAGAGSGLGAGGW
jgi:photosystem II stability/assembly factor-like uncharacterized protein